MLFTSTGSAATGMTSIFHFAFPALWAAAIVLAVLLLSVIMPYDAYRRWLYTDLA